MKRWYYYAKAQAGANWLVVGLTALITVGLLLAGAFRTGFGGRRPQDTYVVLQVFLPLLLGLLLAGLPALERSAGAAELCLTYRQPAWLRLLEQIVLAVAVWLALTLVSWLLITLLYAPIGLRLLAGLALPPALGLGGVALGGGALSRSQVGGILAPGLWWAVDLLLAGFNRFNYLFSDYQPVTGLLPAAMVARLFLTGAAGLLLALWLAGRRQRWVTGA